MILSGHEIKKNLGTKIWIEPFHEKQLNPNSYNLRLYHELVAYDHELIDMKIENKVHIIEIPETGLVLEPRKLYLGRTLEYTKTEGYVPMLEGRSSVGRLGLFIHITAGFGDVGFAGYWTLEMFCIQPVKIYPSVEICQIYYHGIEGVYENYKSNKYQNNTGIQASMMYKDFMQEQNK
jgi:dCTP deaminase